LIAPGAINAANKDSPNSVRLVAEAAFGVSATSIERVVAVWSCHRQCGGITATTLFDTSNRVRPNTGRRHINSVPPTRSVAALEFTTAAAVSAGILVPYGPYGAISNKNSGFTGDTAGVPCHQQYVNGGPTALLSAQRLKAAVAAIYRR
jgi:hypothetical protein